MPTAKGFRVYIEPPKEDNYIRKVTFETPAEAEEFIIVLLGKSPQTSGKKDGKKCLVTVLTIRIAAADVLDNCLWLKERQ